ncbi:nitroreductase family protein [Prolixibacter sp. NT017]|uniref:nitroreductase family protein n=1 Tax=Prolixibacter sp. NT017 TaxID=2652390 RepID=UPI00127438B6|nr:nitroreductase family protein [Prolixibacter sp. NT017]GET23845.1 nitroreductase [Prolixibacter sp. NT017]
MLDLLYHRRSTRKFLDKPVEVEKVKQLITAGLLAPSSKNNRPWEFLLVDDADQLKAMAYTKPHGSSFLANAPLAIIILGAPGKSDVWVEDCSIASTLIQVEAESLGLGSCWVQVRNRSHDEEISAAQYLRRHFDIPADMEVLSIIGIGYKGQERTPLDDEDLIWSKVRKNSYDSKMKF